MRRHIPNTITCCNLLSGCVAVLFAIEGMYSLALSFIVAGAVFDFFDGLTARALKVSSPIGKELDSLADVITFGMAPAVMVYSWLEECAAAHLDRMVAVVIPFAAFSLVAFSALRLAKSMSTNAKPLRSSACQRLLMHFSGLDFMRWLRNIRGQSVYIFG